MERGVLRVALLSGRLHCLRGSQQLYRGSGADSGICVRHSEALDKVETADTRTPQNDASRW